MSGPPPKRSSERRRRNKPEGGEIMKVNLDEVLAGEVEIPAPPVIERVDEETGEVYYESQWHPFAEDLYLSLAKSGQALWYEPSDWAVAYALCETISREFSAKPIVVQTSETESEVQWVVQPVNGSVLSNVLKGLSALMATEGDRRRLRIELERRKAQEKKLEGEGTVVPLVQKRSELFQ